MSSAARPRCGGWSGGLRADALYQAGLVACLLLTGCGLLGGPPGQGFPSRVDVLKARGFFLQSATAGGSGTLMKVPSDSQVHAATFFAANGVAVSVVTSRVFPLGSRFLMLQIQVEGQPAVAVLDTVTGTLYQTPVAPDNWDLIRDYDGMGYYVSSGTLYRLDPSSMTLSPLGQPEVSSTWIHVTPSGNAFVFNAGTGPGQRCTLYRANGGASTRIAGTDSETVWQAIQGASTGVSILEDARTRDVFLVQIGDGVAHPSGEVVSRKVDFIDSPAMADVRVEDAAVAASGDLQSPAAFISSTCRCLQNGLLTDGRSLVQLTETDGALSAFVTELPAPYQPWADLRNGKFASGRFYFGARAGYSDVGCFDVASGQFSIVADTAGASSPEPVKDVLFYCTETATYQYDTVSGITTCYLCRPTFIQSAMP